MTIGSRLKRVTLLPATLATSAVLFAAGGAYAHGHDRDDNDRPPLHGPGSSHNPIVYHPVHGPGSSHNPIVYHPPVVRDHRGPDAPQGGVTVSGGGKVLPPPLHCRHYCGGYGYGDGRTGPGGSFQGVVRDHRG
jgi:hypothetical protein